MAVRAGYSCPKGYKQTEVGVIPEDWGVKRLGEIGEAIIGLTYSPKDVHSDGVLVLRSSNIQEDQLRFEDNVFVKMDIPEKLFVKSGDVLICVRNGSRDLIGKCAQINKKAEGMAFGAFMTIFRSPNNDFVYHQFQSDIIKKQIKSHLGATINQITNKSLNSFQVPLPPTLAEQEAIAAALSDADALIAALEGLIAKKRQIKQGAMQELLTGKRRLPGFSGEWEEKKIEDIAIPSSEMNNSGDDLPVLTCSKHLGFVDSLSYFKNQVFSNDTSKYMIIKKGQIGYPANHVEEGSIGLQDLYDTAIVSPIYVVFSVGEEINSFFLHRLLKLDAYRQKFSTETNASVNRRGSLRWPAFSQIKVRFPNIKEQTAIAEILSDMDAEIAALAAKLSKARQIKVGMMQELLTGRVRLI